MRHTAIEETNQFYTNLNQFEPMKDPMAKKAEFDMNGLTVHIAADLSPGRGAGAITARLRNAIETGVYSDGDQLPPERQLATAFDAARSTIRKALNQLEKDGLVERRIGSGTYVSYSGPISEQGDEIIDLVSPLQLIEVIAHHAVTEHLHHLPCGYAFGCRNCHFLHVNKVAQVAVQVHGEVEDGRARRRGGEQ